MHRLQQQIMQRLIVNPSLRYAKLKPAEVEGNRFMYHLRQLIAQSLVEKSSDGSYALTPAGQLFADRLSLKTLTSRAQPRIITLIVCRNEAGEYLLYKRKRQPLIGYIGFPYGKIHLGETIRQAANRELAEKTGMRGELTHRGDGYITIYRQAEPVSELFFHLFTAESVEPTGATGALDSFWARLDSIAPNQLIPSVSDLQQFLAENPSSRFFAELSYRL